MNHEYRKNESRIIEEKQDRNHEYPKSNDSASTPETEAQCWQPFPYDEMKRYSSNYSRIHPSLEPPGDTKIASRNQEGTRIRGLNYKEILSKGNENWFEKTGISRNRSRVREIGTLLY